MLERTYAKTFSARPFAVADSVVSATDRRIAAGSAERHKLPSRSPEFDRSVEGDERSAIEEWCTWAEHWAEQVDPLRDIEAISTPPELP